MSPIEEAERAVLTEIFRRFPDAFLWIGGSLLHLLYHSPRASLDVDLAPLADSPRTAEIAEVVRSALSIANPILGTHLATAAGDELRIRVEDQQTDPPKAAFSVDITRIAAATRQVETVLLASALGTAAVRVPSGPALLAQKLRALVLRRFPKPGDLFDCWFLLTKGVKLGRLQRLELADEIEAAGVSVEQRLASFQSGRWVEALRRAGVEGLNESTSAAIVDRVRTCLEGIAR